jgi:hypothetical protein
MAFPICLLRLGKEMLLQTISRSRCPRERRNATLKSPADYDSIAINLTRTTRQDVSSDRDQASVYDVACFFIFRNGESATASLQDQTRLMSLWQENQ